MKLEINYIKEKSDVLGLVAKIIHKGYKAMWAINKTVTIGVRALIFEDDKILLVKHTYDDDWYLLGGGEK